MNSDRKGFVPTPSTENGWLKRWLEYGYIEAPGRRGLARIYFANIEPVEVGLLVTTRSGKRFYIIQKFGAVIRPLDLPILFFPYHYAGDRSCFWLLPR